MSKSRSKSKDTIHKNLSKWASFLYDENYRKIYGQPPKNFTGEKLISELKTITDGWLDSTLKFLELEKSAKFHLHAEQPENEDWEFYTFSTTNYFGHKLKFTLCEDHFDYRLPLSVEITVESFSSGRFFWRDMMIQHPFILKTFLEDRLKMTIDPPGGFPDEYLDARNKRRNTPFADLEGYFSGYDRRSRLNIKYPVRYMTVGQTLRYAMEKAIILYDSATSTENYERDKFRLLKHYARIYDKRKNTLA